MEQNCKYLGQDGVTCYGWIFGYCYKMVTDLDPADDSKPRRRCRDGLERTALETSAEEARKFMALEDGIL